jgi:hypothetical protein
MAPTLIFKTEKFVAGSCQGCKGGARVSVGEIDKGKTSPAE